MSLCQEISKERYLWGDDLDELLSSHAKVTVTSNDRQKSQSGNILLAETRISIQIHKIR